MLGVYEFNVCIYIKNIYCGVDYNVVNEKICCGRGVNEKYIYFIFFFFDLFMIEELFVEFVCEVCVFGI